jgi:hypothetical protein
MAGASTILRSRSPLTLTVLGHAALALSLFTNDGSRDLTGLLVVLLGIAAWGKALAGVFTHQSLRVREGERVVWLVALASPLLSFFRAPGYHVQGGLGLFHLFEALVLGLLASYAIDLYRLEPPSRAFASGRRAGLFLMALVLGAWMLKASPDPLIDVFPLHQQTAKAVLDGKSIYEPGVVNVLDTYHHDSIIRAYVYLPLSAYLTAIAFAITHDVRWANLVGQLSGGGLVWLIARRCAKAEGGANVEGQTRQERRTRLTPESWADLVAAMLLFHPRGLLVLEKAWTEPLALPFLGGFVLLALVRRPFAASVCLGFLCAIKQHLALYLPFLLLAPGVGIVGLVIAGAVAFGTLVPSLIRSPLDLYRGAFGSIASGSLRTDALAIPAELQLIGLRIPPWVGFVAAVVPLAWLRRVPRELGPLLLGSCLVFGLFYVCGRQAFCNYYYLLDATSLFAVAALRAPSSRAPRASLP